VPVLFICFIAVSKYLVKMIYFDSWVQKSKFMSADYSVTGPGLRQNIMVEGLQKLLTSRSPEAENDRKEPE
jgi:hypothetical protein